MSATLTEDLITRELRNRGVDQDLSRNVDDRMPCLLLVDVSASMSHGIVEVIRGLNALKSGVMDDPVAARRVQVGVVTYGGESGGIDFAIPFCDIRSFQPPAPVGAAIEISGKDAAFAPRGRTPMAGAISRAIEEIAKVKETYRDAAVSYYRPWIINLTDGAPTDGASAWADAVDQVREGSELKHFIFFNLGTDGANFEKLKELSPRTGMIKGNQWNRFFEWLSNSLKSKSHSSPAEEVPLEPMSDDFFSPA